MFCTAQDSAQTKVAPRKPHTGPNHQCPRGYTLLEMMVVLVIIGLMTGLVAPRLSSRYESYRNREQLQGVIEQLQLLPRRVRLSGKSMLLSNAEATEDAPALLQLPEGWHLSFVPPLQVSALGTCSGSRAQIDSAQRDSQAVYLSIAPITCALQVETKTSTVNSK